MQNLESVAQKMAELWPFPWFSQVWEKNLTFCREIVIYTNFCYGSLQAVHRNFHAKSGVFSSKNGRVIAISLIFPSLRKKFRESLKLFFLHGSLQAVHTNFHAKSGVCSSKNERVIALGTKEDGHLSIYLLSIVNRL